MNLFHVTFLVASFLASGCRPAKPPAGQTFYKRISIDPATLTVSFHDPIPASPEPQADFYWPFYRADGHCSLDHFDTTTSTAPRIRYNALDLDQRHRVISRTKYRVVLTGDFGTFYSETSYQYLPYYSRANTSFHVCAHANSLESEPPQIADSPVPREAQLSVVSVIRVFNTPTNHLLISACYSPDGTFLSISENRSVDGDCREGGGTTFGLAHCQPERFGLPARFPVATYSSGSHDFFTPTDLTSDLDCISLHYDGDRLVSQDIFRTGQPVQTRTLTYKITPEDIALDPELRATGQTNGLRASLYFTDTPVFSTRTNGFGLPEFTRISNVSRGVWFAPALVFSGPGLRPDGTADIIFHSVVLKPDGSMLQELDGMTVTKARFSASDRASHLAQDTQGIRIQPGDPGGTYTVLTTLNDKVKQVSLTVQRQFTIER